MNFLRLASVAVILAAITLFSSCATNKGYGCRGHLNDGPHNFSQR